MLFQIYITFSTILQLDGNNLFDFCGEGWGSFFLLYFPLMIEGVGELLFEAVGCSSCLGAQA